MYYTRNDIMKINKLFRREQNINFWGVPKFRLYRTGGALAEKIQHTTENISLNEINILYRY